MAIRIAVLGTGRMGSALARRLARAIQEGGSDL
ncbi:MAG TPA: NAD(P)-binding domain-containing protein [Candidatus Limnocylindrales bacterium]